jgi:hypothetical protein
MFSTLPTLKTLVPSIKSVLSYSRKGKMSVWLKALSGRKAGQPWGAYDFMILAFFCMWWPGEQKRFDAQSRDLTDLFLVTLYVLYTHMIKLRRKVYGKGGKQIGTAPKPRR